jgi:hypothetical protein
VRRTIARFTVTAIVALLFVTGTASAQELRGTIRDSATATPIPSVVVMLLDVNGGVLGRNITNERGDYRIALSAGMRRVRFIRIGFRPSDAAIPSVENGIARLDLSMRSLPTMLEPVRVSAGAQCPKRKDTDAAFALLEQARAGLLATVVARDANPATLVRLGFDRELDDDRITFQKVRKDSVAATTKSFSSVHDAGQFSSPGFMADSAGLQTFFGPDAEVLLDQSFTTGYCFGIAGNDRARPMQIGLTFFPAERRRNRVDIEGTLWVDTVARALRDIEYRYQGLDSRTSSVRPGGRISFREMPNGVVLIDRWEMRLPRGEVDTVEIGAREEVRQWFRPLESGGELAHAIWNDGFKWNASLGTIRGQARFVDGKPAVGADLRLPGTPYAAVVDLTGHFEIADVLPGPYAFVAVDPGLVKLGLDIPIRDSIVAIRDSVTQRSLTVRSVWDYVSDRCVADRKFQVGRDSPLLIGRVATADGQSVEGLIVKLRDVTPGSEPKELRDTYTLGSNGVFQFCRDLVEHRSISVDVFQRGTPVGSALTEVGAAQSVTILVLRAAPRPR